MRTAFILLIAAIFSCASHADKLVFEAGYTHVGVDGSGLDLKLGAIYGSVGYEWNKGGRYSNSLEGVVILGVSDDSFGLVTIGLEPTIEAAYRFTWDSTTPGLSFFYRGSYSRIDVEIDGSGLSETENQSGFGLGAGVDWNRFTLGFTKYFNDVDDFSRFNIGYRF